MFETAEIGSSIPKTEYEKEAAELRIKLLHAQEKLKTAGFPVLLLINGVDAAGKGDVVNTLHEWMDPRFLLTYGFGEPTDEESQRPPYWRFWRSLPPKGRIGIFFGSWYSAPILKRAYGTMGKGDFLASLQRIRIFEKKLVDDGMLLLKFWLHLGKKEQKKRLKALAKEPNTAWRVTSQDKKHLKLYDTFLKVDEQAISATSTGAAPWTIVEATDRRYMHVTVARTLLKALERQLRRVQRRKKSSAASASRIVTPEEGPTILTTLDMEQDLADKAYKKRLSRAQAKLNALSRKAKSKGVSSILVFEGWDAGGKGGAIRRITAALDSRDYRIVPIAAPTDEERSQHYLWRFWRHMPGAGRITIFDRSWYGRVMVERVEGFATEGEWSRAYDEINDFEAQLTEFGYVVVKYFLHITPEEQLRRFQERKATPWKRFKITEEDWRNREKWPEYERAIQDMVQRTSTTAAPWTLVEANSKRFARVKVIETYIDALEKRLK
ncbi:MAG TPA: polyphosphate:AMP phosphotransferase [Thermoanaerobaculia bacterium]|nr:polyphosphate:AMP phosphotransferase [Thermoanaerobaculia bacterium]HUM30127.1 polyphosphate:AMP phosphotransferase [Thermoanaerobaculia bacterium]HXK68824.1 polyphosphate:AMP phosphotransferase [Thermoanaerobaculia bacterium]